MSDGIKDTIPARHFYERGGWNDGRLGQAYDLIAESLREHGFDTFRNTLLGHLETLDDEFSQESAA